MSDQKEQPAIDLSEEDQELKDKLQLMVQRLQEQSTSQQALSMLQQQVRGATTSMTSIPKPLKFLKPHYQELKNHYSLLPPSPQKVRLANFLSVLGLTMGVPQDRESLKFLLQGDKEALTTWGHQYVRNLCGDIRDQYQGRLEANEPHQELSDLVNIIFPFLVKHNSQSQAVDILAEIDQLEKIVPLINQDNYKRICQYISSSANYAADPQQMYKTLTVCFQSYLQVKKTPEALRIALKLNRPEFIQQAMQSCEDPVLLKQMSYQLARNRQNYEIEDEVLQKIISNQFMNQAFIRLATDLDVLEFKTPEDIYKAHLQERSRQLQGASLDSYKQNLASTIVNAFVNAAYCNDGLMLDEQQQKVFRHKDWGLLTAAASLGMLMLWNVDEGMTKIDRYQYSRQDFIKSGAFMAFGMVNAGIKNEFDPAFALLTQGLDHANDKVRVGIISGLTLAYAGSARQDVLQVLTPLVIDSTISLESSALAALGLGLVFVGTCNQDAIEAILQTLMERSETELGNAYARFFALGIGLVVLGQQDRAQTTMEVIQNLIQPPIKQYALVCVESCAYAGSGNVLKMQEMLLVCSDHLEEKDWQHQMVAVLGVSLIAMGQNIGTEMTLRMFDHLLQYGNINIKRAIPLAMGLLCVSNPKVNAIDILIKLSHDVDSQVAQGAIFALGLVGAGTNNSRLAGTLRQLAGFYTGEEHRLFVVRIAQGLLHMGKGLMTLDPYQSQRFLLSPVALGGILTVLHAMLDVENIIHGHGHYLLFYLACSMYPRMLVTVTEDLKYLSVPVRVGQAVDTVGQAGNPRSITGFQTHNTPVLLSYGERAELATEEYLPCMEVLENFIILKKNPDYNPDTQVTR